MKARLGVIALHVFLVLVCIATLYPVLWVVKMALSPTEGLSLSANPLPTEFTLDNFRAVVLATDNGNWTFGRQLACSLAVSVASTLVGLSLAVTAAYAI